MANQPKKYQKFVATAATATLVATAVVPAASADTTFSDIASYAKEVQEEVLFLADLGVINGFEDGTFKPAQNITRGQAVKMIGRFLEAQGFEAPANWATEQSFSDIAVDRTDRDLVKYAALVKEVGVFQGNGNVLNPSGFTTRENMALILDRLIGQLIGKTAVELAEGLENNVSDLANAKEEAREAIAALNALGVSNAEEFKPKNNTQRVHFASFLARMIELADQQTAEPAIESVEALSKTKVVVTFNTPVDEVTAENFTIEGAVVNGVELSEDKTVATLDVSGLEYNTEYTVAVADVKVEGEAVDFGSQSFSTPAVTQDFELRVTAAEAEVVADGADNVVIKFELLNSVGDVDTNADNMVLEIGTTFGNLATNRVTVQDGVGQVVLSSEFSSKEMIAKVTAQVIEASTDYKDLIGKVAGETTVKFVPAASVLDPNALTFLGAESNQADRVVIYFDKPVSPATFVKTKEDGTFETYYNEEFGVYVQDFKEDVEFKVSQGKDEAKIEKGIVGLASVPGNDKAIEIILAKYAPTYTEDGKILLKDKDGKEAYKDASGNVTVVAANGTEKVLSEAEQKAYTIQYGDNEKNILKDNAQVDLVVSIGETDNERSFTLTDSRKPEFTGVTVANLRTLDLKFSEAVTKGNFSIDGIWTQGSEFDVKFGDFDAETGVDKRDTATITLKKDAEAKQRYFQAGQHSITVTQLEDFAAATDNANISSTQTLNFNVFADLTPPTAAVAVESPEQFRVTFNKDFGITTEYRKDTLEELEKTLQSNDTEAEAKVEIQKVYENFTVSPDDTDEELNEKASGQLSQIFNSTLRVYDAVNKDWVTLDKLTVDGKTSSRKIFNDKALDLLEYQQLLVAKQAADKDGLVNEVVVELTEDWTKLFNNPQDVYYNYQFKFDIEARTFENAANGIMNSSFDLNLNYEGSALNTADNTSPVINDIKQTKDQTVFEIFLSEPVKLSLQNGGEDKIDNAGLTTTTKQGEDVPKVLVEFQGKDSTGKSVVIKAEVDGYSSTTDKDGDSVLLVSTDVTDTLQKYVDNNGYSPDWKVVVASVSDDIGNTAATLTKDFSLVPNVVNRPFQIVSKENIDPETKKPYLDDQVEAIDYGPGTNKQDRIEVTFTKAVNFAGNDNLTSVYNWTLNGTKLSELSNVASITLEDVPGVGRTNDYEKVIITFADDRAFGATSNVVSVTKGIKSLDGTVLTGEYEVVAETLKPEEYVIEVLRRLDLGNATPGQVSKALKEFDGLTTTEQALVTSDSAREDKVEAARVVNQINALPTTDLTAETNVDKIEEAVEAYNALTANQKALVPAAALTKLKETAEKAGVTGPTEGGNTGGDGGNNGGDGETPVDPEPTPVPEVDAETVKLVADAAVGTIESLNGTVDEPLAGVKTVTILNSTLPAEFTGTVNGIEVSGKTDENGKTTIRVNTADELPLTSEIVIKDVNRIAVEGKEVSVTLFPTDDLATLKELAEGELTTDAATATIQTPNGNTVEVDLSKADAIETIFATLTANNVTVADLIEGGSYTVELANEKGEKTTYTVKF